MVSRHDVRATSDAWVAVAYGALEVCDSDLFIEPSALIVVPTAPGPAHVLVGQGRELWLRSACGPLPDTSLTDSERIVLDEMSKAGLVSRDCASPARVSEVAVPWLFSAVHELVCALALSIAENLSIRVIVIKGPNLRRQGLRDREHSGDVDLWVDPARLDEMVEAMAPWGWVLQPDIWAGHAINHSLTVVPPADWGCEIDLHRRMPGLGLGDREAFQMLWEHTEVVSFGGVPGRVPRREWSAVLAALNVLRPEVDDLRYATSAAEAVPYLTAGGDAVPEVLVAIDAVKALREALPLAFPGRRFDFEAARNPHDWGWRAERGRARAYLRAMADVPLAHRPALAFRLLWPSPEAAWASDARAGAHSRGLAMARIRRLRRGVVSLVGLSSGGRED